MTGVRKINVWIKKGMIYLTSRYLTFMAEKNSPKPDAVKKLIKYPKGITINIDIDGINLK